MAKKEQRLAMIVPVGPTDGREVLKLWPAAPMRAKRAIICGIQAYLSLCQLLIPSFGFEKSNEVYLSYVWRMAMPKVATKPMQRALMTHPTAMLRPAPLTAENICPAMMDPMIPQPS